VGEGGVRVDLDEYDATTSRYYDAAYASLRGGVPDVEFYRELALEARGPVLELGCGTGRVLLPIAAEGIPCTGLDASPRMLDALRRKPHPPTLRLVCAPMQDFDLGGDRFALIFSAFRAFQHLCTVEEQLACLACVRRHLAPAGTFAFDVFGPKLDLMAAKERPEAEQVRFEYEGEEIVRYDSVKHDHAAQVIHVEMRYERHAGGRVVGEERVRFRMRYFFRYELEHLLARAGFEEVQIYGGFDRRPWEYPCEQVVVAR
jgi:SAM-dependent methyltransferase